MTYWHRGPLVEIGPRSLFANSVVGDRLGSCRQRLSCRAAAHRSKRRGRVPSLPSISQAIAVEFKTERNHSRTSFDIPYVHHPLLRAIGVTMTLSIVCRCGDRCFIIACESIVNTTYHVDSTGWHQMPLALIASINSLYAASGVKRNSLVNQKLFLTPCPPQNDRQRVPPATSSSPTIAPLRGEQRFGSRPSLRRLPFHWGRRLRSGR